MYIVQIVEAQKCPWDWAADMQAEQKTEYQGFLLPSLLVNFVFYLYCNVEMQVLCNELSLCLGDYVIFSTAHSCKMFDIFFSFIDVTAGISIFFRLFMNFSTYNSPRNLFFSNDYFTIHHNTQIVFLRRIFMKDIIISNLIYLYIWCPRNFRTSFSPRTKIFLALEQNQNPSKCFAVSCHGSYFSDTCSHGSWEFLENKIG